MRRRDFLQSTTFALAALSRPDLAAAERGRGSSTFSYAALKGQARALAAVEYRQPQHCAIAIGR